MATTKMMMTLFSTFPPNSTFSLQNQQLFLIQPNTRPRSCQVKLSRRKFIRISPVRCSLIDGYSVDNRSGEKDEFLKESERKLNVREQVKRLTEILPGGTWWRLADYSGEQGVVFDAKPVTVLRVLQRVWELIAEDRFIVFSGFAALIVSAVSEISIPNSLAACIFSAQSGNVTLLHQNVLRLVIFCVSSAICSGLRGFCFGIANMVLVKRIRERLYSTLLRQDISFFDSETVGDLTSRLGADCQQMSRIIGRDINLILRNLLQGGGSLIYLLVLSLPLGLCALAICSTLSIAMLVYGQYQKKSSKLVQDIGAYSNEVAQETFSLIRTVRVYGTEEQELSRYTNWLDKLADTNLRQSAAYGLWNFSFYTLYHSMQVMAVLIGGMFILGGRITAEQLTKFILYGEWLIYSTWLVGDNFSSLMQSIGASEKVFRLMDLPPSNQLVAKGSKFERLVGHVEFSNVSFCYPSRPTVHVLRGISFKVHPNEVVAIVGLSGSGKSSLVNLLLRLYEPTSGQILIDGSAVKDLDIRWLRERIGYVGQEPRLFRTDVLSNITYGCTRDISQKDVELAAKQAYAHGFITALPNGYKTLVDDDLLSGGQKQRIAIARAILRDPDILILDEATSALDAESEQHIKGVLHAIRSDRNTKRTVIVIAHRLSTIQSADRIVVLEGGRIVEVGSHSELLLNNDGLYSRLNNRQADAVAS